MLSPHINNNNSNVGTLFSVKIGGQFGYLVTAVPRQPFMVWTTGEVFCPPQVSVEFTVFLVAEGSKSTVVSIFSSVLTSHRAV